ncbi:HAD family hydrolase [Nocardia sp. NPDC058499]|uniref:HAD family hydrolase n=1 Tax=Nocardia sp. NPDC058499 TaxID=3346530 RepID=UPI0036568A2F
MTAARPGLVVWDIDGTLIPADLRWLRRAIARTYEIPESGVVFPAARVHGYTDESIVVEAAVISGISAESAADGIARFHDELAKVMSEGEQELARDQPAYPGAAESMAALDEHGFVQTVLTGNLRLAAETKMRIAGLDSYLNFDIGAYGSDSRDRLELPGIVADRYFARFGTPLPASQVVVIGDAPNDIHCARHAGFRVIAVTHRMDRSALSEHSPDEIIDGLDPGSVVPAVRLLAGTDH